MKKIILSVIAIVAFASCNKEEKVVVTPNDSEVRFTSGIATRTSGQNWSANDKIGVFMTRNGTSNVLKSNVEYTTTAGGTPASFTSTNYIDYPTTGSVDFLAYYPWRNGTNATYSLDVTTQDLSKIDFMIATKTAVVRSSNAVNLEFKHKLSNIVINITPIGTITAGDLAGLTVKLLGTQATKATYNLLTNEITLGTTATSLPLKTADNGTTSEGIVIPQPITNGSLQLQFTTKDHGIFTATINTIEFKKGEKHIYNATISNVLAVVYTGTIVPWNDGTESNNGNLDVLPI